jgi:hypothetical protein
LGPPAFLHRPSALDNHWAPLGHHLQVSTHIAFGVATAGIRSGPLQVEGSVFNGREPDENRFDVEFAHSVAGKATSDTLGAGSFGVSSWRLAIDAACILDRLLGGWDLGAQVGLGVDAFNIAASNPDSVPSNRLTFLRLGFLGRLPVGERVHLDAAAAYHLMLGLGLSGRGASYGDSSGEHGADATVGLSGDMGLRGLRLVWSLRLTYQLHRAAIANSNAISFWQNDLLASAQVGASFF